MAKNTKIQGKSHSEAAAAHFLTLVLSTNPIGGYECNFILSLDSMFL